VNGREGKGREGKGREVHVERLLAFIRTELNRTCLSVHSEREKHLKSHHHPVSETSGQHTVLYSTVTSLKAQQYQYRTSRHQQK
jgi:hypothetical protein